MEFFWIFEIFLGFFFINRGETTLGKVIQEAQANKTWATVDGKNPKNTMVKISKMQNSPIFGQSFEKSKVFFF